MARTAALVLIRQYFSSINTFRYDTLPYNLGINTVLIRDIAYFSLA